ncbi:hypothetical protein [Bacillus nitroreducens]
MNKKEVFTAIAIVIICVGYFINEHSKKTTFAEVLENVMDEEEIVEQITIYDQPRLVTKTVTATITDNELIEKMLKQEIKLKEVDTRTLPPIHTTLVIQTDKDSYEVGLDDMSIMVGSVRYVVEGWSDNWNLIILRAGLDWEIIEYTPFNWR